MTSKVGRERGKGYQEDKIIYPLSGFPHLFFSSLEKISEKNLASDKNKNEEKPSCFLNQSIGLKTFYLFSCRLSRKK